ncbi:hypothetical protein WJX74_002230 [Apatococcus lobatus]|uniref:Splicing factor Cactin n=1 Tax=Apatococcus lobatus TaxID=904363 RepID=A0AAW1RVI9_9CHLO
MGKDHKHSKEKKRKRERDEEEERKQRRHNEKLAKKIETHLKKHRNTGHGYNNEENPFGDSNLGGSFVWGKKIQKQLDEGADKRDLTAKAERQRQSEREAEIEKVKRRREEREAERARQEEELSMLQRERAAMEARELEQKEEHFHLEQARERSERRLREGRPKPIDLVAHNLASNADADIDVPEPYEVFEGLALVDVRELHEDIQLFQDLDSKDEEHAEFWKAMMVVCNAELELVVRQDEIDRARMRGERPASALMAGEVGVHASLETDIHAMLAGKRHVELQELEASIESQLRTGNAGDPEYWGAVLKRLHVHKAKARLREIHATKLRQRVEQLMAGEDVPKAMGWVADDDEEAVSDSAAAAAKPPVSDEEIDLPSEPEADDMHPTAPLHSDRIDSLPHAVDEDGAGPSDTVDPGLTEGAEDDLDDASDPRHDQSNIGQYSPEPLQPSQIYGQDVVSEQEDRRMLDLLRAQVRLKETSKFGRAAAEAAAARRGLNETDRAYQQMISDPSQAHGNVHPMLRYIADAAPQKGEKAMRSGQHDAAASKEASGQEAAFQAASARLMGDAATAGDAPFGGEVQVDSQVYWWHDKYRPRKPKYFNRVHTGYEWNKYNQTHYDHDNPPPKVVQGYKFNIFYPDLINKSQSPTFELEKDPQADEHGSTCLLRLHAGPPYEDIAFRVVNKEWEYSHKKGYKCTFERGILHLYFNFKRQRYRR